MEVLRYGETTVGEIAKRAAGVLRGQGLIVYPTETAYGLGGDARDPEVVKRVFDLKQRPADKPVHIIVRGISQARRYAYVNRSAEVLVAEFLPGPLTLVLEKKEIIPEILTGGLSTVGIRIPDHPVIEAISARLNFPYTATSANLSGGKTPYDFKEVINQLPESEIDLVIDGGELPEVQPSTVLDLTVSPVRVLREGPVAARDLGRYVEIV